MQTQEEEPDEITVTLLTLYRLIAQYVTTQRFSDGVLAGVDLYFKDNPCEPAWTPTRESLIRLDGAYWSTDPGDKNELYEFLLAMLGDVYTNAPDNAVYIIEKMLGKNHPFGFVWKSVQLVVCYPPELIENYFLHGNMLRTHFVQSDTKGQPTVARVLEHIIW